MNARLTGQTPMPAEAAPMPDAYAGKGSQVIGQLRQGLQSRQNRKLALAALVLGGLYLMVHDWSGGRVESRVTGNWTAVITDGNEDWEMTWSIRSRGGYEAQTIAVETGQLAVGRNNLLTLTPKNHPRRQVQLKVKSQQTIYLNGPVVSPGEWTEWTYDGQGGSQGVTLTGVWTSQAKTPGLRGARLLEIDAQGNYKFVEKLQAKGEMRAKGGEFTMVSQYDNYGDAGKYQMQAGKLALSSKRFKSLVLQRSK